MADRKKEQGVGISSLEVKQISDQILSRTDSNHPQLKRTANGFLDILQNGKPDLSASPVFVTKVSL